MRKNRKVDYSYLNIGLIFFQKNIDDVTINLNTYFDAVGNRSYTFLRIAITKIRTEIPTITIKAHKEDRRNFV